MVQENRPIPGVVFFLAGIESLGPLLLLALVPGPPFALLAIMSIGLAATLFTFRPWAWYLHSVVLCLAVLEGVVGLVSWKSHGLASGTIAALILRRFWSAPIREVFRVRYAPVVRPPEGAKEGSGLAVDPGGGKPPGAPASCTDVLDTVTKKCPQCAEYVKCEAKVCRFCGYKYDPDEVRNAVEAERAKLGATRGRLPIVQRLAGEDRREGQRRRQAAQEAARARRVAGFAASLAAGQCPACKSPLNRRSTGEPVCISCKVSVVCTRCGGSLCGDLWDMSGAVRCENCGSRFTIGTAASCP